MIREQHVRLDCESIKIKPFSNIVAVKHNHYQDNNPLEGPLQHAFYKTKKEINWLEYLGCMCLHNI